MLPSKNRVNKTLFKEILKNGRSIHSPSFSFKYLNNPISTERQFSVVVSKKVLKRAVDRNLLKRRIYSILKEQLKLNKPYSCVIWPKKEISKMSYAELSVLLLNELKKIRV